MIGSLEEVQIRMSDEKLKQKIILHNYTIVFDARTETHKIEIILEKEGEGKE